LEVRLNSKLLHSVNYDPKSKQLTVFLNNGRRGEFVDVPEYVLDDLQATMSPGSYYVKLIKRQYQRAGM
jgi:hypothetical protein